uniref:Nucleolar and coiled-body phosphoprotein 1-like n=1 Tax=Crassostrea virginica TaxID=6565 RepID=A0A8B8B4U1_CRAVI|nr:nucleolar and coiled-body phosphoprotein 1-like [Crassostrea virginica]
MTGADKWHRGYVQGTARDGGENIDECEFITSAIKRLAIEPQVANDQKTTKEPKRQSRTWSIKKQARMKTKQRERTSPKVNVPPKTNNNDTAPGQSQSIASAEPNGAPGKMMSSARNDKKGMSKPYQREKHVSKNSSELIPSPALRSATTSSQQNQDGDKKGTEGNNVSAQGSDSTEAKLKDFAGKMNDDKATSSCNQTSPGLNAKAGKLNIDKCDFITSAIKRLAIEPQVANDQKTTKEPKRQSRTLLIKKQARMKTKQKNRTSPKVPPKTNDSDTAPGQSQSLASAEPSGAPGKMMSSARKEKKEACKPCQKEKPAVSKNCELIPGPALRSATASSQQNQDGDKKNPVPMLKLEEQISSFLKSIRYSGTEGNNVSAQSSDSTEAKLKDFTGKMNYSNKDPKNQAICSKSATQCDNTRVLKRQSRKRQKDPSIATTCSKKHKLDSWTSDLESLIKDFKRLTLN